MKKKACLIYIILISIISTSANSQTNRDVTKVGTTAASFLEIGIGSRAVGMGEAFTAIANDAAAIYWNPSVIAQLQQNEAILLHTDWLADINFEFAALSLSLGTAGVLGLSITSMNMGDMPVRTIDEPDGTGERYSVADWAVGITYAKNITDRFSLGATVKYIHQQIWHMNAAAVAFDVGTLFTTDFNNMKIGMAISNFGNKMQLRGKDAQYYYDIDEDKYGNNDKIPCHLDTDKWALPLIFRVGVAMDILHSDVNRITIAVDALHPNNNTESVNLGMEYSFNEFFFSRCGYNSMFEQDGEGGATFGGGIYTRLGATNIKFDYSYSDHGRLLNAQRFCVGLVF